MTLMTNLRGFKLPPLHLGEECSSVFMLMGCTQTYQDTGGGVSEQAYVLLINKISLGGGGESAAQLYQPLAFFHVNAGTVHARKY